MQNMFDKVMMYLQQKVQEDMEDPYVVYKVVIIALLITYFTARFGS